MDETAASVPCLSWSCRSEPSCLIAPRERQALLPDSGPCRMQAACSRCLPRPSAANAFCFREGAMRPEGMMMSKKIYVGNLPFSATADELREAFSNFGTVTSAQVVSDRETGRSRGFGFVEMSEGAEEAIDSLNGAQFGG